MSLWELEVNGSGRDTLAAWGLGDIVRSLVSQGVDTVTLRAPGQAFDGTPKWARGDTVTLYQDGVRWFQGRARTPSYDAAGGAEDLRYQLDGPWWYLENLVFKQDWTAFDNFDSPPTPSLKQKSRALLGRDIDGLPIDTAAVAQEAVSYCIAKGAPFQAGDLFTGLFYVEEEFKDLTCADVIKKMLRWHPDVITLFDYTTTPPTLHLRHAAALPAATLDLAAGDLVADLKLSRMDEADPPVVVIHYEVTGSIDGDSYTDIVDDIYPAMEDPDQFGALALTIPLQGLSTTVEKVKVRTKTISADTTAWWKKKLETLYPGLEVAVVSLQDMPGEDAGTKFTRTLADEDELDHNGEEIELDEGLDRELVYGSVPEWLADEERGKTQVQIVTGLPDFTLDGTPVLVEPVHVQLTACKLSSRTYRKTNIENTPEPIPAGLARAHYEALRRSAWRGSLTLVQEECAPPATIGNKLNLAGGQSSWATMAALVQEVTCAIDTGTTSIKFGEAGHLSPQDLVELMRARRKMGGEVRIRIG